jgi:hypothetical protein
MIDLSPYIGDFDDVFPEYGDGEYAVIRDLADTLQEDEIQAFLDHDQFDVFVSCLLPLIEIRNYKAQVPFPTELRSVLGCMLDIAHLDVGNAPGDIEVGAEQFELLMGLKGFDLPTVSAVFHFCFPNHFPIVDRYVNAADRFLYDEDQDNEFRGQEDLRRTVLPAANTSIENKKMHYNNFIRFVFRIADLQAHQYGHHFSIREIDKGLMVMGKNLG